MQKVLICQICKEPIHNFVCIDSLAEEIKRWLPTDLSMSFGTFNNWFLSVFNHSYHDANHTNTHVLCNSSSIGNICVYCYVNEVFQWLVEQNKAIGKRFRDLFSFGMKKTDFREVILAHAEPISEVENMNEEFGICDECGEYADELKMLNGRWICHECGGLS
jgi:hypothetical protein